jgi:hypothetical protein
MRQVLFIFVALLAAANAWGVPAIPQEPQTSRVVDRIVARIESDIILESQVRELGAFQQLIEGRAETDDQLLSELIEQWIVQAEAAASRFPDPTSVEVDRELGRLTARFASAEAYVARLHELGLSATQARQLLVRQIYIERYLDYKFRPSTQIESAGVDAYYRNELLPELAKKNKPAPRQADVEDQIRELLAQREITELAVKWLDETKSHLKIERAPPEAKP